MLDLSTTTMRIFWEIVALEVILFLFLDARASTIRSPRDEDLLLWLASPFLLLLSVHLASAIYSSLVALWPRATPVLSVAAAILLLSWIFRSFFPVTDFLCALLPAPLFGKNVVSASPVPSPPPTPAATEEWVSPFAGLSLAPRSLAPLPTTPPVPTVAVTIRPGSYPRPDTVKEEEDSPAPAPTTAPLSPPPAPPTAATKTKVRAPHRVRRRSDKPSGIDSHARKPTLPRSRPAQTHNIRAGLRAKRLVEEVPSAEPSREVEEVVALPPSEAIPEPLVLDHTNLEEALPLEPTEAVEAVEQMAGVEQAAVSLPVAHPPVVWSLGWKRDTCGGCGELAPIGVDSLGLCGPCRIWGLARFAAAEEAPTQCVAPQHHQQAPPAGEVEEVEEGEEVDFRRVYGEAVQAEFDTAHGILMHLLSEEVMEGRGFWEEPARYGNYLRENLEALRLVAAAVAKMKSLAEMDRALWDELLAEEAGAGGMRRKAEVHTMVGSMRFELEFMQGDDVGLDHFVGDLEFCVELLGDLAEIEGKVM